MNILIRFEDRYGCNTLFKYSHSCLNTSGVDILGDFSADGVFKVLKRDAQYYDYIIMVFDLDSSVNGSLTSMELLQKLKKTILHPETGKVKDLFRDKIILVPVFFCFETIYFYSKQLQQVIADIDVEVKTQTTELIKLYKAFYDYSMITPDNLDGILTNIDMIQFEVQKITGFTKKTNWLPQKFHLSYAKQLLKLCDGGLHSDKLFEKHEEDLFKLMQAHQININLSEIYNGLQNSSDHNCYLKELLFLHNADELKYMTLENRMLEIFNELDTYNLQLKNLNTISSKSTLISPKQINL